MYDKLSGVSLGYGFVDYVNADDAQEAIRALNGLQCVTGSGFFRFFGVESQKKKRPAAPTKNCRPGPLIESPPFCLAA